MKIAIDIAGLDNLDGALAQLGVEVATKIGERAFKASAEQLRRAWIGGAPYQPKSIKKYWTLKSGLTRSVFYGHLKDNIKIRRVKPDNQNAIVFGVHTGNAFWAHFLEFGTVHMPARPWARPIVERIKDDLIRTQVVIFNEGIESFAARASRGDKSRRHVGGVRSNGRSG